MRLVGGFVAGLTDLVFPPRCAGCDLPGAVFCPSCQRRLQDIPRSSACPRCGAPLVEDRCVECAGRSFAFERARAAGVFAPPLSRLVTVYKDAGERRLVPLLGELLAKALADEAEWAEALVPVPPRPEALARRGFDHMLLVARDAGARMHVPVHAALRATRGADQRVLGREQRRINAEGRFRTRSGIAVPARAVLVDDVFTTGATLDACARVLLGSGCEQVRVAVLARATDVSVG